MTLNDNRKIASITSWNASILFVSLVIVLIAASCGRIYQEGCQGGTPDGRRAPEEMILHEEYPASEWENIWLPLLEVTGREPFTDWEGKSSLSRLVTSIITRDSSGETPEKAMEALYNFVHKEVNPSGIPPFEDGSAVPRVPWLTVEQKTGTALDIAFLYRALLNEAWIKAFIVPVRSRGRSPLDMSSFSVEQFDHVLVYVPPGYLDRELWLDPSTPSCPFEMLPPSLENAKGIILDPKDIRLVDTPRSRAVNKPCKRVR